jgi:beta-1,4-mannosyltransferase
MIVYIQRSKVPTHRALDRAMAASGVELRHFQFFFLPLRRGIVFIHWPDSCVGSRSFWKMIVKFSVFLGGLSLARLRGLPIVWEVNNIRSHEGLYPTFEAILMTVFTRLLAGSIHNSKASVREALEIYPVLKRIPWAVIPESNFRHIYPERGDAIHGRRILGVNCDETVLLSFGLIRRYKGADKLIEIFKQLDGSALRLIIAGMPVDEGYARELQCAAFSDSRIRLIFQDIPDADVPHIYAATALHCAPFRAVLNSASVLLALSFSCPVLASCLGTMPDLEEQVGSDWIMLYGGELDLQTLQRAIAWTRLSRQQTPALGFCDFGGVVTDTLAFLTKICHAQFKAGVET